MTRSPARLVLSLFVCLVVAVSLPGAISAADPADPSFASVPIDSGAGPISVGDLNGDAFPEIVVTASHSTDALTVELVDGHGGYTSAEYVAAHAFGPAAIADLNGDTFPDLAVASLSAD